ncbi:MAG: hypothetical protein H0X62_09115, partial [Bacteroidetes bacterium]|nr:hypothetical protein [Bacteroidota bacterium]
MDFNGTEGEFIPLNDAAALTSNYRAENPNGLKGIYFGGDKIKSILSQ